MVVGSVHFSPTRINQDAWERKSRSIQSIEPFKSAIVKYFLAGAISFLIFFSAAIGQSPASWEELRSRPYPQWFRDAKLGIFIHWGVYSVPSYSGKEQYAEWFLRGLQTGDSLRIRFVQDVYGKDFTYRDFAPLFKAELFDPAEWAALFRRAGARYVVLVSKHHDGYSLWPDKLQPGWNSMDVGPGRDLVGELSRAVRQEGLKMGLYYSFMEWNNPLHRWGTDPDDEVEKYVDEYMVPQFRDLVSTYRPSLIFGDGDWSNSAEQLRTRELISWYFDLLGEEAIVNDRFGGGSKMGFITPEYSAGIVETERPWAEVRGLGRSFGLNRNEKLEAYMTSEELVHFFIMAVANGGGIIINVGPGADGQIPLLQQERLMELGKWLEVNGEAIYGARSWKKTGEIRPIVVERVDKTIDFDWVRNSPARGIREDDFSATWTGLIQARQTANYTFEAEADDFIRVWIDGKLVIDSWETPAAEQSKVVSGGIRLEKNMKYPIHVEYREEKLNARARLYWSVPGEEREIIPQSQLSSEANGKNGDGLLAVYSSLQQYLGYTVNNDNLYAITFEWPGKELELKLDEPLPPTRVSLVGRDGELPWRYENGTLYIDLQEVQLGELPCPYAWTFRLEGLGGK